MRSNLSYKEFQQRLKEVTEPDAISPTLAFFSRALFHGESDNSSFRLRRDTLRKPTKYYVVKGTYEAVGSFTEVTYDVRLPMTHYVLNYIMPVPILIFLYCFYFAGNDNVKTSEGTFFCILTIILLAYSLLTDRIIRKRIDKKFKDAFEIEV
jgi:hypothetical protein